MRLHRGCKKRFKVTATGKVRFFAPGGQHNKYRLSGRQVQDKRKPRYLERCDEKRIKVALRQARNKRPAWGKRWRLKLRSGSSQATPDKQADATL
mmetsp:Transcript_13617/g.33374  ORF Transcript_13617/g.33374 Transcript_13617/m.33374 type:complete len:95 (+) Transcript_13617:119-403(+)